MISSSVCAENTERKAMTVREAAAELHDACGNHFVFAANTPERIYKALIELRRAMTAEDQGKVPSLVAPEIKRGGRP